MDETEPWPHPAGSESTSLLWLLSGCRNLEYLCLQGFRLPHWWPHLGHGPPGTAVQLPSLRQFSFGEDFETDASYAVVALAVLDPCIASTASVDLSVHLPDEPNAKLSSFVPSHVVQHHPFDTVVLSGFWSGLWAIRCLAAQALRLEIRFESYNPLADFDIEDVFRTAAVTHLEIIPDAKAGWS